MLFYALSIRDVEGKNETGYFTIDFTLEEVKKLRTETRIPFRDQSKNGLYQVNIHTVKVHTVVACCKHIFISVLLVLVQHTLFGSHVRVTALRFFCASRFLHF